MFAPVLIVVSIWLYTLVFAFSALWFAHYLLAALQDAARARRWAGGAHGRRRPTAEPLRLPPAAAGRPEVAA